MNTKEYKIFEIGIFKKDEKNSYLEIYDEFLDGINGLTENSKILVFLWFNRSDEEVKRKTIMVHPRGNINNPIRGVFSTRSPMRPNPIALYTVKIEKILGNKIYIEEIDAFSETPLIDIKNYSKELDF
ncbi:tRNA-Thr(GGU) m(6)t(6)A37 methyltransferase TsaA [Methanococcus maripaludis]|uniref:tRNA-Thr(GGU) m(6)t(6)A37 methyltransferase TsaA n=1 Tax=Methanococcus maripaludis TaxID=39152 RepID=A0A7J9NZS8_METMI|nr:tRNA (N6-threonylcarbamoyladenosine(37)-N6)-methyltransferase TrmO [Methanococcus maripaludis]MBA2840016.1 tRNA-Thr(GGU) m(6)t(6)A37 methyltransferase TsaA [Methanococcus maripaludis]MBA2852593.1 tRNA-Thr(GGU) m(6)t(6)A37 methyltransferase TsaA [Methanococcus maripaludis]MBA2868371.1 tRNA-Thr(GGU) m(6)t(6)A37 methyltransferase TsaA [Methanococcus maripaludis]MBB6401055.1 tRNA-Thr(GGU) m(6)t(6)A37 methyltransferase TsaA [Methanococcus maripaludis]